jgi:hypothetical protein
VTITSAPSFEDERDGRFVRSLGEGSVHDARESTSIRCFAVTSSSGSVGSFVRVLNLGEHNTVTLGDRLIVSTLSRSRYEKEVRDHEMVHVSQAELLGLLYLPAYVYLAETSAPLNRVILNVVL